MRFDKRRGAHGRCWAASRVGTALVLAATTTPGVAAGDFYVDLGPLILILGIVTFVLFVWLGRAKGAVAFFALSTGVIALVSLQESRHRKEMLAAHVMRSEQCFTRAGNRRMETLKEVPSRVFVRLDPTLRPGDERPLTVLFVESAHPPGVEVVPGFVGPRAAGAVYVEILSSVRPIGGVETERLAELRAEVTGDDGRVIASHLDIQRNTRDWCLGSKPPASVEAFLQAALGRSVGLSWVPQHAADRVPVVPKRGDASAVQNGRFHESAPGLRTGKEETAAWLARLPAGVCERHWDGSIVCLKGTSDENTLSAPEQTTVHVLANSWLSIQPVAMDSVFFDALAIAERSLEGRVLRKWHVRFRPVDLGERGPFAIRAVVMEGRRLSLDVVADWHWGTAGSQIRKEWFEKRVRVSVLLDDSGDVLTN